jgi:hypothetical protein
VPANYEGCALRPESYENIIRVCPCSSVAKKLIFMVGKISFIPKKNENCFTIKLPSGGI